MTTNKTIDNLDKSTDSDTIYAFTQLGIAHVIRSTCLHEVQP